VGYLKFEDVTFVPIQQALIDRKMLTVKEVEYLNNFHQSCRSLVGAHMLAEGGTVNDPGYLWLMKETEQIN